MKVLTTGRLGEDFCNSFIESSLGITVKYVEILKQTDIEWADCLASFAPKDEINLNSVKWIHSFGAGVESYLNRHDLNRNLILSRTVGNLGLKMGEYCLCHVLNFSQNSYEIIDNQVQKKWVQLFPKSIRGKTALLIGTGKMAQGISIILKSVGVNTFGVNRSGTNHKAFNQCLKFGDISSISQSVDFVINTLPYTNDTENLLSKSFFSVFRNILFINVGRGKTVNITELKTALKDGNCAFAVLDVFEQEPLPKDSELWSNRKILITPHQSAITDINDIVMSFNSVYESIKGGKNNDLLVNINKGY